MGDFLLLPFGFSSSLFFFVLIGSLSLSLLQILDFSPYNYSSFTQALCKGDMQRISCLKIEMGEGLFSIVSASFMEKKSLHLTLSHVFIPLPNWD